MAGSPEKYCVRTCPQVEESAEISPLDLSVVMFSFLVSSFLWEDKKSRNQVVGSILIVNLTELMNF